MKKNFTLLIFILLVCLKGWAQTTTYTTTGTYTVPANVYSLIVECWGAGGAGGGVTGKYSCAGGGSGGGYVRGIVSVVPGTTYTVTIGAGGAISYGNGGNGGASWFGSATTILAIGGNGSAGVAANNIAGAGAPAPASGNIGGTFASYYGGAGANAPSNLMSGGGGSSAGTSANGNPGNGINGGTAVTGGGAGASGFNANSVGGTGASPGGGGSGTANPTGGDNKVGGAGGAGKVVVYPCTNFTLTGTSATSSVCSNGTATVTLNSAAASLPVNTYTVTYNISAPNAATGLTATMNVTTAGTGTFITPALTNAGVSTITITNLGTPSTGCNNGISVNNTANVTVLATTAITAQPSPATQTLCQNSTATALSVIANGANVTYQWYKNTINVNNGGILLSGATSSSYTPSTATSGAAYYYVVVSGSCGTVNSNTATVTVNATTAINTQPLAGGQTICQNTTATALSVAATGAGTLTYQWYSNPINNNSNGTMISGATSSAYTPATASAGTTYYYVVVNGSCGTATSNTSAVIVNATTAINSQPSPATQTVCQNGAATPLSITATGTSLTYQWYKNTTNNNSGGTSISDASSSSYTPSTATAGTNYYYVTVTGSCGTVTSGTAAVVVNAATAITTQPSGTGQTLCLNTPATALSVNATGTNLAYQWYSNTSNSNTNGTIISGATSASYTPVTTTVGTTYYYAVVSGSCSPASVTSTVSGAITVTAVTTINASPSGATYCQNATATALSVGATGTGTLTYQWYGNTINSTTGGTAVGTNSSTYTPVTTSAGTLYYYALVSGSCGTATSTTAAVTVNAATGITAQPSPATQTVCQSTPVNALSVSAAGTGTLTYQWYSNTTNSNTTGTIINGATSSSYTPPAAIVGTTYYYVVVSGSCGTVNSSIAVVIVNAITGITSQPSASGQIVCQNALANAFSVIATGTNLSYQWYSSATNNSSNGTMISGATSSAYIPTTASAGTTYYYVVVNGSCGTVTSNTTPVTVYQKSTAPVSATASSTTICAGSSTTLILNGGGGGNNTAIKWYTGACGNGTPVGTGNNLLVSPAVTTTYYGRYEDGAPCNYVTACASVTITVNALPAVAAITGPVYVGVGRNISLQDATTGGIWSIDNTAYATISSATSNPVIVHGVSAAGTPVVTYTVTNPVTQCKGTAAVTIHVFDPALAHFLTNQDGKVSNKAIWNINRMDGNGEVPADEAPGNDDNITIRHNVLLNQSYNGTSSASVEITGHTENGNFVAGTLTILPNKYFSSAGGADFGGHPVIVQSDSTGTGYLGAITNNSGTIANATNVTVERYFGSSSYPGSRRAWQLVTAPVTGVTINNSWQEGLVSETNKPVVGNTKYGTIITGHAQQTAANAYSHGYDFWDVIAYRNASILRYKPDPVLGTWDTLPDPGLKNLNIESYPAYMLFVRGNRAVLDTGYSIATIRATGTLKQGLQVISVRGSSTQSPVLIGNPFAAPIDFEQIFRNSGTSGILHQFKRWNSNLGKYGAFELVNGDGPHYTIIPAPFTGTPTENDNARYIPSGSGFLVMPANGNGGTLTIDESAKAPTQTQLINPFRPYVYTDKKLYVNLNLKNNDSSVILADGVLARFDNGYADEIDVDDVQKQTNFYENLSIASHGTDLMVEARPGINKTDTTQLRIWNIAKRSYQLQLKGDGFDSLASLHAWLEDTYLDTKQPVSLTGAITTVDFVATSDSASFRSSRFRIVFRNDAVVLPVTFIAVKATEQNGGVNISWTVANEININHYTVEYSTDGGRTYIPLSATIVKNDSGAATAYNCFDALPKPGNNLYRIKAESKEGNASYSNIVALTIGEDTPKVRVAIYPNPVKEGKLHLQLSNLAKGTYLVSIYTVSGQNVYRRKIMITQPDGMQHEQLLLGNTLAQGHYQLHIADDNGAIIKRTTIIIGR